MLQRPPAWTHRLGRGGGVSGSGGPRQPQASLTPATWKLELILQFSPTPRDVLCRSWVLVHTFWVQEEGERERALLKYCHPDPHSWDQAGFWTFTKQWISTHLPGQMSLGRKVWGGTGRNTWNCGQRHFKKPKWRNAFHPREPPSCWKLLARKIIYFTLVNLREYVFPRIFLKEDNLLEFPVFKLVPSLLGIFDSLDSPESRFLIHPREYTISFFHTCISIHLEFQLFINHA